MKSGGNVIQDFFKDHKAKAFFEDNGMKTPEFIQYAPGNHALGGLVESAVKLTRRMLSSSIKNNILDYKDFEVAVAQCNYHMNKRPITFKAALRDANIECEVPEPITPELLVKGYDTVAVNVIPEKLGDQWQVEANSTDKIVDHFNKLSKIRNDLKEIYHKEFMYTLMDQANDKKHRYNKKSHTLLAPGDIVLLKEEHSKALNYPIAVVIKTVKNTLGEVTDVKVRKGANREVVNRHVSSVIPFCLFNLERPDLKNDLKTDENETEKIVTRPKRQAAIASRQKCREQMDF